MPMETYDYKITTIEQKEKYLIFSSCDRCKKLIFKKYGKQFKSDFKGQELIRKDFYSVTTGHYDWGNDSCDSIETRTICAMCISKEISDYVKRTKNTTGSGYIDIHHTWEWSLPSDENLEVQNDE